MRLTKSEMLVMMVMMILTFAKSDVAEPDPDACPHLGDENMSKCRKWKRCDNENVYCRGEHRQCCPFSNSKGSCNVCMDINDPCQDVKCASGYECRLQHVVCVRAPCPPLVSCEASSTGGGDCPLITKTNMRARRRTHRCRYNRDCDKDEICCDSGRKKKCIDHNDPCKSMKCKRGYSCYMSIPMCIMPPCPMMAGCSAVADPEI